MIDFSRLTSWLNTSKVQKENNSLYQVILNLITGLRSLKEQVDSQGSDTSLNGLELLPSTVVGRRDSSGGAPEQLTIGAGLSITANVLDAVGGGGGITQLTGDVTAGPGAGAQVATIAANVVTFAKTQTIATQVLVGRNTAGTGDEEQVTISQALDWL